ncbi:hypothetical protein DSCO28_15620 [Desulfosarcina ovata subsp. sediminis]|uniref:Histidine kinase domain-containing protein n=1 Tax=Desulfosarcina ovata subsp. sediminis TaxID=885957 RepID=A0A5K7ZJ20_9BACT|nr:hypothetical protein [Desulfosarcina ovata]BBO80996.1 hypothetical protein DSCO28_15620 [Desulfosarcina ovata subsp. sediminis]
MMEMPQEKLRSAVDLLAKIPELTNLNDMSSVDMMLCDVLEMLIRWVDADIGQINMLSKGGKVEKMCVIKDGTIWLKKGMPLHLFQPLKGFTGHVLSSGQSMLIRDIWADSPTKEKNPFIELLPEMDEKYLNEIKKPVASTLIVPIKRGNDIISSIELSRYRDKTELAEKDRRLMNAFAERFGTIILDYIIDIKNRINFNIAHVKLKTLSRLIASNVAIEYRDVIEAYNQLSASDVGIAFIRSGSQESTDVRLIGWDGDYMQEVILENFTLSENSSLRDDATQSFPIEGCGEDERMRRFLSRLDGDLDLSSADRHFISTCTQKICSYIIYPLHLLSQDLGAVVLASKRQGFVDFLQMNPFLSLYHSLFKSFLLNERMMHNLSRISLKVHNPGFYVLAALKSALIKRSPQTIMDPDISQALAGMDALLSDLHNQGRLVCCSMKNIRIAGWLRAYINQKKKEEPGMTFKLNVVDANRADNLICANEERLETIIENIFANSMRAINEKKKKTKPFRGQIDIDLRQKNGSVVLCFQDNGIPYKTISGRGLPQLKKIIKDLGGTVWQYHDPYRLHLSFPLINPTQRRLI